MGKWIDITRNRADNPMKFMAPFLMAMLPIASAAKPQSATASGVPSIAIPKTTAVLVIETPEHGVTPQQVMPVMPEEIRATVKLYLDGKIREGIRAAMAKASSSLST
jgi:hypothetical protein